MTYSIDIHIHIYKYGFTKYFYIYVYCINEYYKHLNTYFDVFVQRK